MKYLSVCSGIEAATVAWQPLGWKAVAFAEIEKFPSAVLAHHYPDVPNLGDVYSIKVDDLPAGIDILVGGFPCQDLSVAGKRKGMKNDDGTPTRSGLFYRIAELADAIGQRWTLLENVPGLLSSAEGRDFASVVGELAGTEVSVPRGGWQSAGVSLGPKGLVEWAILDAQYFGLAQRRKRVFIVRDSGDWASRPPIFLVPESLSGNPAPRRETGKATPDGTGKCAVVSCDRPSRKRGLGTDAELDGALIVEAFGGNNTSGPVDVATAVNAHGGPHGRQDFESETFVTHSLSADGFDAGEDGTGRGTPLVPVAFNARMDPVSGDIPGPIDTDGGTQAIASQSKASASQSMNPGPISPALDVSKAGAVAVAVAVALRGRDGGATAELSDIPSALRASTGGGDKAHVLYSIMPQNSGKDYKAREVEVAQPLMGGGPVGGNQGGDFVQSEMLVRRLTPLECSRLQGFPDEYLNILYTHGKMAADGPRYKALGNSMAVPVMRWIGGRIALVSAL